MKRLQHYKFISSIRSRAAPARCSCSRGSPGRREGQPSRRPFVSPMGEIWLAPHPPQELFPQWRQAVGQDHLGVVFMWQSKASSGIPGRLLRIHFHPWPQTMPCPRPQRWEATVTQAEFADLWNHQPWYFRSIKQRATLKAGVPSQVTAPRYLPFMLTILQTSEFLIHSSPPPGIHILFKYRNLN